MKSRVNVAFALFLIVLFPLACFEGPTSDTSRFGVKKDSGANVEASNQKTDDAGGQEPQITEVQIKPNQAIETIEPDGDASTLPSETNAPDHQALPAAKEQVAQDVQAVQGVQAQAVKLEISALQTKFAKGASFGVIVYEIYSDNTKADVTNAASLSSSAPNVVKQSKSVNGQFLAAEAGSSKITAVSKNLEASVQVEVTEASLMKIALVPPSAQLAIGGSLELVVEGTYSDGSKSKLTDRAHWSVADLEIISEIEETLGVRRVNALKAGQTSLTATVDGLTSQMAIKVNPNLDRLAINQGDLEIPSGLTKELIVTAIYEDQTSQTVTKDAIVTTSSSTILILKNSDKTVMIKALQPGRATIDITYGKVQQSFEINVLEAILSSLIIELPSNFVELGSALKAKALGTYSDGVVRDVTTQVIWSVNDTVLANSSNIPGYEGQITALKVGEIIVTASIGQTNPQKAHADLEIRARPLPLINLTVNGKVQDSVFEKGTNLTINWSSTYAQTCAMSIDSKEMGTGISGSVSMQGNSNINISVRCVNSDNEATVRTHFVTIAIPKLVSLSMVHSATSAMIGNTLTFVLYGTYDNGQTHDVTQNATWSMNRTDLFDVITVEPSYSLKAKIPGTSVLTAIYGGISKSVSLTVIDALDQIILDLTAGSVRVGESILVSAQGLAKSGTVSDISPLVAAATSNPSIFAVSRDSGGVPKITGVSQGTASLLVQYEGKSVSKTIRVDPPAPVTVSLQVDKPSPENKWPINTPLTLSWTSQNSTSCDLIIAGDVRASGTNSNYVYTVVTNTTATVKCVNLANIEASTSIAINATEPTVAIALSPQKQQYLDGDELMVTTTTSYSDRCSITYRDQSLVGVLSAKLVAKGSAGPQDIVATCHDSANNSKSASISIVVNFRPDEPDTLDVVAAFSAMCRKPNEGDINQDGVDGEKTKAVFVSATLGVDHGDGSYEAPYKSLQKAIDEILRGSHGEKKDIYVAGGVYAENLKLQGSGALGLRFFGGYEADFSQRTSLERSVVSPASGPALVIADVMGSTPGIRIDGFEFVAADARLPFELSSRAVVIANSSAPISFVANKVRAGRGVSREAAADKVGLNGCNGSNGKDGTKTKLTRIGGHDYGIPAAVAGAAMDMTSCTSTSDVPGLGGTGGSLAAHCEKWGRGCSSKGGASGSGKAGGNGGTPNTWPTNAAQPGFSGISGARGLDGASAATASTSWGDLVSTSFDWVAANGPSGSPGTAGQSGGGGGGGGAVPFKGSNSNQDTGSNYVDFSGGGAGGNGGQGGGAGPAGEGGAGAGGSFGFMVSNSQNIAVSCSEITTSNGGTGGNGGIGLGGQGGLGGLGGKKLTISEGWNAAEGGKGGNGGNGGNGGRGAGGNGGHSVGFLSSGASVISAAATIQYNLGQAGTGGEGGVSGNPGQRAQKLVLPNP